MSTATNRKAALSLVLILAAPFAADAQVIVDRPDFSKMQAPAAEAPAQEQVAPVVVEQAAPTAPVVAQDTAPAPVAEAVQTPPVDVQAAAPAPEAQSPVAIQQAAPASPVAAPAAAPAPEEKMAKGSKKKATETAKAATPAEPKAAPEATKVGSITLNNTPEAAPQPPAAGAVPVATQEPLKEVTQAEQVPVAAEPVAASLATSATPAPMPEAPVAPVVQTAEVTPEDAANLAPAAGPSARNTDKNTSPDGMFIAAGQVGNRNSNYATAGVMQALPGSKLGNGWVARVFAEEIGYRYQAAGNRDIDGRALGGSASFGYQHSYTGGWFGTYAGVAYHDTRLSPNDPNSKARGSTTAAHLQAEGEQHLTKDFKLNANGVADISSNTSYWARMRALYRVTDNVFAGPEGMYQGDKDYKSWASGLAVVGMPITDKSTIGVDAGVRKTQNVPTGGYAGLEFGMDF